MSEIYYPCFKPWFARNLITLIKIYDNQIQKTVKMRGKVLFLILFSVVLLSNTVAQKSGKKITISGTVLDVSKNPVVNAIVMIDGKNTSAVTDPEGKYKIKVPGTATKIGILTFTNGMIEESISGRTEINFNFSKSEASQQPVQNAAPGEEGINTGYAHVKKKNLTTDITKVDGSGKKYQKYSSIYDMIQREVSGIKVNGDNMVIQDSRDLFGTVPALLVVDGVPVQTVGNISPSSVESIEVLKGTSAAIYGSRGYGGAVVIKTKIKSY
jgi:TonB-dependent starch-binding outer membrane protein SusC